MQMLIGIDNLLHYSMSEMKTIIMLTRKVETRF